MATTPGLFTSIPSHDQLALFDNSTPKGEKIVGFLQLTRSDVAKAAKVSLNSVRYDIKMPELLEEWLREVALTINMVATFFKDKGKTTLWSSTPNPTLGNLTPIDLVRSGRVRKLLQFVQTALDENPKR